MNIKNFSKRLLPLAAAITITTQNLFGFKKK